MITVLTPTYNRAHTLERLYNSLVLQKNHDFEWLIVDDGSTDNTLELIECFIKKNQIDIKFFFQKNKGKPSAVNFGVEKAAGDYIFIVDSDDKLTFDSIYTLKENILFHESRDIKFSGLCYRKADMNGSILGRSFDSYYDEAKLYNSSQLNELIKVDLAYCFKKSYMNNCRFPYFENEKFVPELYIWNKITDIDKVYLYANKAIYLCEYLPDGLTFNFKSQLKQNPNGFLLYYKDQFFRERKILNKLKMLLRSLQCIFYKGIK